MRVFHRFPTQHDDLIHDVSYDFYGKRLATCSSDQKIKVWDLNENGKWVMSAEWKSHSGSVWKVAWAHPEYGQVLASCSFDRTVCIWEEGEDERQVKRWQLKATLVDSRDSVTDIKFAPKAFGLRLATCSCDGYIQKTKTKRKNISSDILKHKDQFVLEQLLFSRSISSSDFCSSPQPHQ
ncbi:hypothetical protein PPL_06936 [Heterostelium album PN500]|uniref:Uncharacterized protein n=1 Tax=Heterostelium pallidum (strain ATCC 26659 / Pp 5 / PN500) TaxID=670386 RepID=D3BDY3_HETP5|nr:hypothetical protein PPL_06936 [Heterostelium album PN500]EFA80114.1 hypothetical protein PPL_06936 [Heterostelium album PN500]|eukprot:XP_020432234.1 hypothetical protein PPL_06936 [Heterostelium album PN500]